MSRVTNMYTVKEVPNLAMLFISEFCSLCDLKVAPHYFQSGFRRAHKPPLTHEPIEFAQRPSFPPPFHYAILSNAIYNIFSIKV